MELEVLQHSGLPATGVLSVRAGGTRRQVLLKEIDRPLKFPCAPEDCPAFKVDVLEYVGSGRLAYSEEAVYNLTIEPPEGVESATPMEVSFAVRRCSDGGDVSDSPASPSRTANLDDKTLDRRREKVACEYLESHGLLTFMQFLMQSLMKDKPADPYCFLQKQVTMRMVSGSSKQVVTALESLEKEGLQSLSAEISPEACMVAPEQLAKLQFGAAAAGEQLRADNQKLREMADNLRLRYNQLLSSTTPPAPEEAREDPPSMPPPGKDTPQLAAYRDIAQLQDDITSLAIENSKLVSELSEMRLALDSGSRDIVNAGEAVVEVEPMPDN